MPRVTDNVTGRTPFIRADLNNRGFIRAIATTGATLDYPYKLIWDDNGWRSVPIIASTSIKQFMVGFCSKTVTTNGVTDFQIIGPITGLITTVAQTSGYDLTHTYNSALIETTGAVYDGNANQIAVARNTSTALSTSAQAYITGQFRGWLATT